MAFEIHCFSQNDFFPTLILEKSYPCSFLYLVFSFSLSLFFPPFVHVNVWSMFGCEAWTFSFVLFPKPSQPFSRVPWLSPLFLSELQSHFTWPWIPIGIRAYFWPFHSVPLISLSLGTHFLMAWLDSRIKPRHFQGMNVLCSILHK